MIRAIDKALDAAGRLLHALATFCLLLMFLLINVEVMMRYLLNRSTMISDEYSGYFFCWLIMLGLLATAREGLFLRVEFLVDRLSDRGKRWTHLLGAIAGLFVTAVLAFACYELTAESYRFGSISLQISETPLWIPQAVAVFGLGLLGLHYLMEIVRHLAGVKDRDRAEAQLPLA